MGNYALGTLGSHALHQKQMALVKQSQPNLENMVANNSKMIHRPSSSTQLGLQLAQKSSMGLQPGRFQQSANLNKTMNLNKLSQTMGGSQQEINSRSKSKNDKVNQIIKKNLKKQKQKTDQKQHQEAVKYEREKLRKRELQMQNELVRQINKEKIQKQKQNKIQVPPDLPKSSKTAGGKKQDMTALYSNQYQNKIEDVQQNSNKITNMSLIGNEGGFPYRRSQERGNQRMLSGSGGKSGSRVVSIAGRSGRSGGAVHAGGYYVGENSAHAGGKKDSVNSNLTQQMTINNQQSQQIQSLHQGDVLQLSQKMDTNILRAANYPHLLEHAPGMSSDDILEHHNNQNQDDSILKNTTMSKKNKYPNNNNRKVEEYPDTGYYLDSSVQFQKGLISHTQQSEDFRIKRSLNSLEEEESLSYDNTKNITQLIKEEQSNEGFREMFQQNTNNLRSQKVLNNQKQNSTKLKNQIKKTKVGESTDALAQPRREKVLGATQTHKLGLDYLDVKKEIINELKQVDKKGMEKLGKRNKVKDNTMIFQDNSIQDLRIESFINNLQRQIDINKLRSKSSSPQIRKQDGQSQEGKENTNFLANKSNPMNISTAALQTNKLLASSKMNLLDRLGSQSSLTNLHQLLQNQSFIQNQGGKTKKQNSSIQKYIKNKNEQYNRQQVQEKQEEISKIIRQKQNLEKLEAFTKKKLQQSFNHQNQNSISAAVLQLPEFMREKKNKKNKNRSASRERKMKKEGDRMVANIQEMMHDDSIQIEHKEDNNDMFSDLNIFNNQFSGNTNSNQQLLPVVDEYNNLDIQLNNMIKRNQQKKKDNNSFTSASLREFGDRVTDSRDTGTQQQHTPKGKKEKIKQNMNAKMKRSKSQQRCLTSGFPQTSPNIQNRKNVFQFQNKHTKTIEQDIQRIKDKSHKKLKNQSITHRNNKLTRIGKSQMKLVNSNKKKANSASKSRSRNKKSSSKSKEKKDGGGKYSRSLPGSSSAKKSNSKSNSKSKSKSRSHSRSIKNNASKKQKKNLQQQKGGKQKKSTSPEVNLTNIQKHKPFDPINSDFDYNKFMHGTIKISPRITKLSQYVKNSKPQKLNNSQNQNRRRRNRSCTKTHNQIQLMNRHGQVTTSQEGIEMLKKPKSQQNAHSQERVELSGHVKKQKENKTLQIDKQGSQVVKPQKKIQLEVQKGSKQKKNKTLVNQEQLQEILKKVNLEQYYKQQGKKKKNVQHQFIDVQDQSHIESGKKQVNKSKLESSGKLDSSLQKKIIKGHLMQIEQEKEEHQQQLTKVAKKQPDVVRISKSQPQKQQQTDLQKQKQLKELLKQIHKKNEELKQQQELNQNLKLATELNQKNVVKKQGNQAEYSSVSSSKRNLERFSEKWVDIPAHQQTSLKGSQLKNNRFSELSGNQSQKSLNNFTFFEKQTSIKDFIGKSSDRQQSIGQIRNNMGAIINSSGGDRDHHENMMYDPNLEKLQKLYLNNIDMENSSGSQSIKILEKIDHEKQKGMDHLKIQNVEQGVNPPMSNRSGRSAQSGIMMQIQGLATSGQLLRADNEIFYPQLLNNQGQAPNESHRSMTSNNTYNINNLNKEIMVLGSEAIVGSSQEEEVKKEQPKKQEIKQKFFTVNEKEQQKKQDERAAKLNLKLQQQQSSQSSKYVQNFQSTENKLSSQMNLNHLEQQQEAFQGKSKVNKKQVVATAKEHRPTQKKEGIHLEMPHPVQNIRRNEESVSQSIYPEDEDSIPLSQKSLKISQINIDKTIESKSSNQISGNEQKVVQSQNSFDKQFNSQSMPYSLMSHQSKSHRSDQSDKKPDQYIMNEMEQGPHTLISHLNEPQTDPINMNDGTDSEPAMKFTQQISPLETNVLPDDVILEKNTPAVSSAQNSEKQQTAENLLKYLDNKYKEKKQENSSQFDHSRASNQSDQQPSRKNLVDEDDVYTKEDRANRYKVNNTGESSRSQKVYDNNYNPIELTDVHLQIHGSNQKETEGAEAASPPDMHGDSGSNIKTSDRKNESSEVNTPSLIFNRQRSDQLEEYLDIKIDEQLNKQITKDETKTQIEMNIEDYEGKEAGSEQESQTPQQTRKIAPDQSVPEMVITSNLTTLNLDGGDSSSDGGGQASIIDKFRKRQAKNLDAINRDQGENDKNIEIDIQENSPQPSLKSAKDEEEAIKEDDIKIQMNISPKKPLEKEMETEGAEPPKDEAKTSEPIVKISELLKEEHENVPQTICSQIINDIIDKVGQKDSSPKKEEEKKGGDKTSLKNKIITTNQIYTFISSSINQVELKHQIKQVIEMKQRQYIENDLIRSDDYINELLSYLMQFEMLTQHQLNADENGEPTNFSAGHKALLDELGGINYLILFLKNLTNPIKKNLVDILHTLRTQEQGSYAHFESVQDPLRFPIIPIDVYLDVEKQREFEFQMSRQHANMNSQSSGNPTKGYLTGQSGATQGTASVLQESQHILNKSIFDAMNESLTKFRPYGIVGEPLPWSNKYRRLQTEVDINSVDTERLIQMVKQEVFRWMSTQQGALMHTHDTIFQYIDLQIPYMPEIEDKVRIEQLKKDFMKKPAVPVSEPGSPVLDAEKEKEKQQEKEKQDNIDKQKEKEEKNKMPELPNTLDILKSDKKSEEKPEEEKEKNQQISQKPSDLQKTQDEQFQKFKKTLIDNATQELRQTKLANQLQQEVLEDEHFWLNYEFEETQIRIDLSDMILNTLMEETITFLNTKQEVEPGPQIEEI